MYSHRYRYGGPLGGSKRAWQRLDARVAKIMQAVRDAGNFENTNFSILGDHYQINDHSMIHLNVMFAQHGWVTLIDGKPVYRPNWKVTAKTCDGETYVYTRGEVNKRELKKMIEAVDGVQHVYTAEEATKLGADPTCTFLVEAETGYYFTDEVNRPAVVEEVDPPRWEPMTDTTRFTATAQRKTATLPPSCSLAQTSRNRLLLTTPTWLMRDQPLHVY